MKWHPRLIVVTILYIGVLAGVYMLFDAHINRETSERVFTSGLLTGTIERTYACRCITQLTPTELPGVSVGPDGVSSGGDDLLSGYTFDVTETELARLDAYLDGYERTFFDIGDMRYFIYYDPK